MSFSDYFNDRTITLLLAVSAIIFPTALAFLIFLHQNDKIKKINTVILYTIISSLLISTLFSYLIISMNRRYFIDYEKDKIIAMLYECDNYINFYQELVEKSNIFCLNFIKEKINISSKNNIDEPIKLDKDNPPYPIGLVLKTKDFHLFRNKSACLIYNLRASNMFSNRIERFIEEIYDFAEHNWYEGKEEITSKKFIEYETMFGKDKIEKDRFSEMLFNLSMFIQKELNNYHGKNNNKKIFPYPNDALDIDLQKIKYGNDISLKHDLSNMLKNSEDDNLIVVCISFCHDFDKDIEDNKIDGTFIAAKKLNKFKYSIVNDNNKIKHGNKFLLFAFKNDLIGELAIEFDNEGAFIFNKKGEKEYGTPFTSPNSNISKSKKISWCSIWE